MITYEISGRRYVEIVFKKVSISIEFRVSRLFELISERKEKGYGAEKDKGIGAEDKQRLQ